MQNQQNRCEKRIQPQQSKFTKKWAKNQDKTPSLSPHSFNSKQKLEHKMIYYFVDF